MKGSNQPKEESINQEMVSLSTWSHWTKAAVAFAVATSAHAVTMMVGAVWGESEAALPSTISEAHLKVEQLRQF